MNDIDVRDLCVTHLRMREIACYRVSRGVVPVCFGAGVSSFVDSGLSIITTLDHLL